jgi:hypothetical protein
MGAGASVLGHGDPYTASLTFGRRVSLREGYTITHEWWYYPYLNQAAVDPTVTEEPESEPSSLQTYEVEATLPEQFPEPEAEGNTCCERQRGKEAIELHWSHTGLTVSVIKYSGQDRRVFPAPIGFYNTQDPTATNDDW